MNEIEAFIREYAAEIGMDPDVAVRAAMSEGGLTDPFQQSHAMKNGVREPSYGPLQLLIGGPGTGFGEGVGNRALAAGIDPRKDWQAATRFGLDYANQRGWGEWYGPRKAGIGRFEGIAGRPQPKQYALSVEAGLPPLDPLGSQVNRSQASINQPPQSISGIGAPGTYAGIKPATARPGGPVEAAGGGMGNEAGQAAAGAAGASPGRQQERKDWWDQHFKPDAKAMGEAMAGMGAGLPAAAGGGRGYPGAARVDAPDAGPLNMQMAEMQRMALAEAMAKLNAGRLF